MENTIGPVLKEKFEALRLKLRKAQTDRKAFFDRQKAFVKSGLKPEPDSKADLIGQELVDEPFDVKVLDPAMGSGHFLVEAVDFITDKALDFLNAFPWNPVSVYFAKMRQEVMKEMEDMGITIDAARLSDVNLLKRHDLKRCIYGVDLLLALLNSAILDWYFGIVSTNSKVNEYQFNLLPVPTFFDDTRPRGMQWEKSDINFGICYD